MLKSYIDLGFKLHAYAVGYFYLAWPYLLSFIFHSLKKVIEDFEKDGSNRSIFIISLISGSFYHCMVVVLDIHFDFGFSTMGLIGLYIGYVIWGCLALFLMADYRLKGKQHNDS